MNKSHKNAGFHPLVKTLLAPLLFELCGIIPLLLVVFGVINISVGIKLRNALVNQYGFVFFIIATLFFAYALYVFLRQKNSCNLLGLRQNRKEIIFFFTLLIAAEALLLFLIQVGERVAYGTSLTHVSDFLPIGIFLIATLALFVVLTEVGKPMNF